MAAGSGVTADDFAGSVCPSGVVTIAVGGLSALFGVSTKGNDVFESDKEFTVTLTDVVPKIEGRITISDTMSTASATISDNDAEVGFEELLYEVLEGAGSVTLIVELSGEIAFGENVVVDVRTVNGTAGNEDYDGIDVSLEFTSSGLRSVAVSVNIINDALVEGDEYFEVMLSGDNVSVTANSARVTIMDDPADRGVITVTAVTGTVLEGEGVSFRVELTGGVTANEAIDVVWSVNCGAGSDVTAEDFVGLPCSSGISTIDAGSSFATFIVDTNDDNVVEGSERFTVTLSSVSPDIEGGITISDSMSTASVTITDEDRGVVSVTVGTSTVPEGGEVTFTVELGDDVIADEAIGVEWSVSCEGDITSLDFVGGCPSGTATIAAGGSFATFIVSTADDSVVEGSERFTVTLSSVSPDIEDGITISDSMSTASVTIRDNDVTPPVEIGFLPTVYSVEEDAGNVELTVSVLSGSIEAGESVTVVVMTVDGSAGSEDYNELTQTLVFSSIMTEATVTVVIVDDAVVEGVETFDVMLSGEGVSASMNVATVTITDGDSGEITLAAVSGRVSEGDEVRFTVSLSGDADDVTADAAIGVIWSVSCDVGLGVSALDFAGDCPTGTATIAVGQTSTIFTIMTDVDSVVENDEEFVVTLSSVSPTIEDRITISGTMSTASVTITDEAVLSVSGPDSVEESLSGMSVATFTVSLADGVTAVSDITLLWRVTCATDVTGAASPADFANGECPSGTETILAGETSAIFSFTALDDNIREGTERFTVSIATMTSGDFNVIFDDGMDEFVAELNLLDEEAVNVDVLLSALSVLEGDSLTFNLLPDRTVSEALTLPWAISFDSASASDFADVQELSGTVTIEANMLTSASVTVSVASDTFVEGNESFYVIVPVAGHPTSEEFVIQSVEFSSDRVTILDDPADRGVITITAVTDRVFEDSEVIFLDSEVIFLDSEVTFRVDLSGGVTAEEVIVVEWRVSCGAGNDVTAEDFVGGCPSGTVTIASGETLTTFAVSTNDDNVVEGMEKFVVTLSSVSPTIDGRITISDTISTASVTIVDNNTGTIVISKGFQVISAGLSHTCGIIDGEATCWGIDFFGPPTPPSDVQFRALSAGRFHTCGIIDGGISDGEATCWGDDRFAQSTPPSGVRFRALSAGRSHTCGIIDGGISDGEATCWGLGSDPNSDEGFSDFDQSTPPEGVRFLALSAGGFHTCGIIDGGISDGEATCWGDDFSGQSTPPSGVRFRALSAGVRHTCGIIDGGISDGEATCWDDFSGQFTPPSGVRFRALSVGDGHTCGIIDGGISDGEATCWDDDFFGQPTPQSTPPSGVRFRALSAGEEHTCGIIDGGIADGEATCWGSDSSGRSTPPTFPLTEGDEAIFIVSFSSDVTADEDIFVDWSVSCSGDITADDFADSSCPSGTVTIPSGETSERFAVFTADDNLAEGMEEFEVILTDVSPRIEGRIRISDTTNTAFVTILDNDVPVEIGFSPVDYEVSEFAGIVTLVAVLSGALSSGESMRVNVMTIDSTAVAPSDYVDTTLELEFTSTVRRVSFTVRITSDRIVEGVETFAVKLSGEGVSAIMSVATVTIRDTDRGVVLVTVGTSTVPEGGEVTFTVGLGNDVIADEDIFVDWSVNCDAGSDVTAGDFVGGCPSGTVTIASGGSFATFIVSTNDDGMVEGMEEFEVILTDVSPRIEGRIRISDDMGTASVTIVDDDVTPPADPVEIGFLPARYSVLESAGIVTLTVSVLSGSISDGDSVTVTVMTLDDSAVSSEDYDGLTQTLVFSSSVTEATVTVVIVNDPSPEDDEEFRVTLSGDRVSLVSSVARVTILANDEVPPVDPVEIGFSPTVYSVLESAGIVTLTVSVLLGSIEAGSTVEVTVMTMDEGSAISGEDYTGIESVLTFTSESTTQTVTVVINGDALVERSEVLTVRLATSHEDVILSAPTASVTITDEAVLSVSGPGSVEESATGMNVATFTVSLPDGVTADADITVAWSVVCVDNTPGFASAADFAGGTCPSDSEETIVAGDTSAVFSFTALDDGMREGTESFTVSIVTMTAGDFNVIFGDGADEFVTELNLLDEQAVNVRVISSDTSVDEGDSLTFNLVLDDAISEELSLPWVISFVSASESDFMEGQEFSGMVTIPANSLTSAPVTLTVAVDDVVEGDEVFSVVVPIEGRPVSVDFVIQRIVFSSDDVTINDAVDGGVISVRAVSSPVDEGSVAVFTVELTGGVTDDDLSVVWSVDCGGGSDVTAGDFVGGCPSGTVTIASGETSATFAVYTNDDSVVERVETFTVTLLNVSPEIDGLITISADLGMASVDIRDTDTGNVVVSFDRGFRSVSGSNVHTCGIREDGLVECWGDEDLDIPPELADVRFRALSTGSNFTCGIVDGGDDDGKLRCWGSSIRPLVTPDGTELANVRFRAVNTGEAHSCGIRDGGDDDGKVECWGPNTAGQSTPLANVRFRALSLGEYYSCGIVDGDFIIGDEVIRDGEVECWGTNFAGQSTPTQDVRFRALSTGFNHTCGIIDGGDRDGEVDCWGALGLGGVGNPDPPMRLAGVRFRALGSGVNHGCGIIDGGISDGEVDCWGSDADMRSTPPTGLRLLTLGSGRHHNCGVQEDGTVACWGRGDAGQTSPPSFAIPEGDEVSFRASFSGDVTADEDISVGWSVSCDSGVNAEDFVGDCPSGTVRIAAGSGFGRFTIRTDDDMVLENAEEFTVSLIEALPSIEGRITISSTRSSVTATITDNDTIDIGFEDLRYDVREDVGSVTLTVSVLSGEIGEGVVVTVDVRSIDGRAVAGADYTSVRESLTFSSEVISRTLSVSILEDGVVEGTEEFELRLSGESISSAAATAEVSIRDIDNGVITLEAVRDFVSEGEAANFRLELTEGSTETGIGVEWSVSCEGGIGDSFFMVVSGEDFVGGCPSGTATIAAGQTSTIFTILTDSDSVVEGLEEFTVTLLDVSADIADRITISGTMSTASVIIEDEAVLSVSVPDFVEEIGMNVARFTVSLPDGVTADADITVAWIVNCVTGGASAADFVGGCPIGTATIVAGETSVVFSFTASSDNLLEGTESFTVSIVTVTAGDFDVVFDDGADGFVREFAAELDLLDAQSVNIDVLLSSLSVSEGESLTFNLLLDDTVSEGVILPWAISFDSASALDFAAGQALSGTVEIPANMLTSALVTVDVASDDVVEVNEFFNVIVPVEGRSTSEEFEIQSVEVSSDRVTILDDPADLGEIIVTAVTGTVSEGGDVSFRVELTGGVTANEAIDVLWGVSCGSGSDVTAEDFVGLPCPSGISTINAGGSSVVFSVETNDDSVVERVETVTVTLSRLSPDVSPDIASRIRVSDTMGSASAEITDNDTGVVSVTVVTSTVSEGDEATFRVILSEGFTLGEDIGVSWSVNCEVGNGITAGDFVGDCPSGVVTLAVSSLEFSELETVEVSATFIVETADDSLVEGMEEFTVRLTGVSPDIEDRVTISDTMSTASATINDNDAGVGFEPLLYRVSEAAVSVTLFVVLSGEIAFGENVIVNVRTVNGTAGDQDYEGRDEFLEITSGSRRVPVSVNIINDSLVEGDEYFVVTLSGALVSVAASSARVTILDDDRIDVTVEAATDRVSEGDEVRFTVSLSNAAGDATVNEAVVVIWSVSCGGDITAGDFDGSPCQDGTVTIDPGASSATFRVRTSDDNVVEGSEGFTVTLLSVSPDREGGITISESMSTASVTIMDTDRGVVSVTVGTSTVPEGGEVTFTVELTGGVTADEDLGVVWSVSCEGDITSLDFVGGCPSGTVLITSGSTSSVITVMTNDDELREGDERFTLSLTEVLPSIEGRISISTVSTASVTIPANDEDVSIVEIGFDPTVYSVDEDAGNVELTVVVSSGEIEAGVSVAVTVMTVDGTAVAGEDYTELTETLVFSSNVTEATVTVDISDDHGCRREMKPLKWNCRVIMYHRFCSVATVTIMDDDEAPPAVPVAIGFSPTVYSVDEDAGSVELTVVVSSGEIEAGVSVAVTVMTVDGTAVAGEDYTELTDTLVFSSNVTEATVTVDISDDTVVEGNETFEVELSGDNVSSGSSVATVTIRDDTADRGVISVTAVTDTVSEGSEVTFLVDLSGGVTAEEVIVVEWRVSCGADSDVTAEDFVGGCPSGTVTIASGETLTTFAVSTNDDNVVEGMEVFTVTLSTVSPNIDGRITISDTISTASVAITDNDTGIITISSRVPRFRALSAGGDHTCGIVDGDFLILGEAFDDGEATCWGSGR